MTEKAKEDIAKQKLEVSMKKVTKKQILFIEQFSASELRANSIFLKLVEN